MWTQNYRPLLGSVALSGLAAAVPLFVLGYALAVRRLSAWKASVVALLAALAVAVAVYDMPVRLAIGATAYGAAFGLFPLGWVVFAAILLYDIVVASGRFDAIRRSLMALSPDRRIQALLIAFAFGAFIEGASGAGTPVAVSASLLVGIGFPPLLAGGICLLANTAPVAYGALGLPIITLAGVTELPLMPLSAAVGRICPIVGLIVPTYLVAVLAGRAGTWRVWPALVVCGVTFAASQFLVSNLIGPQLADIISAVAAITGLVALLRIWQPATLFRLDGDGDKALEIPTASVTANGGRREPRVGAQPGALHAWMPYLVLVVIVLIWGAGPVQRLLDRTTISIPVPGLHRAVERIAPVVPNASPYPAVFTFNWLAANGTACFLAALLAAVTSGLGWRALLHLIASTARRLLPAELAMAFLMAIAFVMNYAGATATLGLALAATGGFFVFFGAYLGWLGVFLTGSDTSSNALFGNLQVVTARALGLNPVLMAAVNTCGGVMGKMISVASIAVAAAATGMAADDEGKLFRFTLWHSVALTAIVGLVALAYAYLVPHWMPVS